MNRKTILIVAGIIALIVVITAGWYLASPLFINNTVEEAFPFDVPQESEIAAMSNEERNQLEADFIAAIPDETAVAQMPEKEQMAVAAQVENAAELVMMDKAMDDDMMAMEGWTAVLQGQFSGADEFHMGAGSAVVYQQGEQQVLRFEDFSVTNGPDLHVILSKNPSPADQSGIGTDYLDLGALKGNLGSQNYEIPAGTDLSEYHSVVIYCVPFHVVFAMAALG